MGEKIETIEIISYWYSGFHWFDGSENCEEEKELDAAEFRGVVNLFDTTFDVMHRAGESFELEGLERWLGRIVYDAIRRERMHLAQRLDKEGEGE